MKNIYIYGSLFLAISLTAIMGSCSNKSRTPGSVYAPDMTYSRAYESYTSNNVFADGQSSRTPLEGTVAIGESTTPNYDIADSAAIFALGNPLELTDENIKEGGRIYNIHCAPCHGTGLDGQGHLYTSEKYPLAPANLKDPKFVAYSVGRLYYTIMFGKNRMGSYASQMDEAQRWKVIAYIKNKTGATTTTSSTPVDSTKKSN